MFQKLIRLPLQKLLDMSEFHDIAIPDHNQFETVHEYKRFIVSKLLQMEKDEEIPLKDVTGKWRVTWY